METLVSWLKPLFVPLLKLDVRPPHLPEGSSLVRHLKPSDAWLTLRAVTALFGLLNQVVGTGVLAVVAVTQGGKWGIAAAAALGVLQLAAVGFALVVVRVDWELRHYLVGDRSVRVSSGVVTRREVTVSYANVQNVEVTQGPLERIFGIKTVTLSTAGADLPTSAGDDALHVVALPGLDDADGVKSLILGMLQHQKDAGLGEPVKAKAGLSHARLLEVRDAALAVRAAVAASSMR